MLIDIRFLVSRRRTLSKDRCVFLARSLFSSRRVGGAVLVAAGLLAAGPGIAFAQENEDFQARYQATYVRQHKSKFSADYSGPRSLGVAPEQGYSFTATVALGWRLARNTEFYLNPEAAQGVPLGGLAGLGGLSNGEAARTAGPTLRAYRARAFVRHTWGLGGDAEAVESDVNQLAGSADRRRVVLTAGNLSVLDLFDDNAYSHDPRTQFLNWSLMTHGAYDYAADARGYTWGAALEYFAGDWALRAGRFAQPREPNQQQLDPRIGRHYGDQIELERGHVLGGQPGRLRMLAFRNQAVMAAYADALAQAQATGLTPDLSAVRSGRRAKQGVGINLEQALAPGVGLFARAMRADGRTETYAFTEIDRSASAGLLVQGSHWSRPQDSVGVAWARNGLSGAHRAYLAAGGLGFFIGDGRLRYAPEQVVEAFWRVAVGAGLWLTLDWQRIAQPAYNADRGPVSITSLRAQFVY